MNLIFNGYRKCADTIACCETLEQLSDTTSMVESYVDLMYVFKKKHIISRYEYKTYCLPYFDALAQIILNKHRELQSIAEQNDELDKQSQSAFAQLCAQHDFSHSFETIKVKGFYHEEDIDIDGD